MLIAYWMIIAMVTTSVILSAMAATLTPLKAITMNKIIFTAKTNKPVI